MPYFFFFFFANPLPRRDGPLVEHKLKAFKSEKERYGFEPEQDGGAALRNSAAMDSAWYKEVLELRKKAGEYRVS